MGSSTYCKRDDVDTQREDGVVEIFGGFGVGVGVGGEGLRLGEADISVNTCARCSGMGSLCLSWPECPLGFG